jgi:hypothetical protein
MGCEKIRASLQDMMGGRDLGEEKKILEDHLSQCSGCRDFYRRESEIDSFLPRAKPEKGKRSPVAIIAIVLMFFALYSTILILSNGTRKDVILTQEEKLITEFIVSWKDENLLRISDRIDPSNFVMIMSGISETRIKSVDRIVLKERQLTSGEYADIGKFDIKGKLENNSTFDYTVTLGQRRDGGGLFLISID